MKDLKFPLQHQFQLEGESPEKGALLIVLHGRGDSIEGFTWLKDQLKIPGLSVLLFNAPDDYYGGYSWYDLSPNQLPGVMRSRDLLKESLDQVIAAGFDPKKIILAGFSQGCLMTLEFGGRYHHRLAGYLGISGYCHDPAKLVAEAREENKKAPWLITHGTKDEVIPVVPLREQIRELQAGGFNLEYREYNKGHTIEPLEEFPVLRSWIAERIKA